MIYAFILLLCRDFKSIHDHLKAHDLFSACPCKKTKNSSVFTEKKIIIDNLREVYQLKNDDILVCVCVCVWVRHIHFKHDM
jgi:hypothetical protein